MGFKIYNSLNASHVGKKLAFGGRPFISVTHGGAFYLCGRLCQMLRIKKGDQIVFLQDEQYPSDWYIKTCKKPSESGFELKTCRHALGFRSNTLADIIAKSTLGDRAYACIRFWCMIDDNGSIKLDVKHPKISDIKPLRK